MTSKQNIMKISCHVLDLGLGKPAFDIKAELFKQTNVYEWTLISTNSTNTDGRIGNFADLVDGLGIYKVVFHTDQYFKRQNLKTFYPVVEIIFQIDDENDQKYHIPLLLNQYGYSTYRGS